MRVTKYRAWNKKKKSWLGVNLHMAVVDGMLYWQFGYGCEILSAEEKENIELSEYTGLKDKEGIEIYEGDIVKCVSMNDGNAFCDAWGHNKEGDSVAVPKVIEKDKEGIDWNWFCDIRESPEHWEIIGNLYENPELMEANK